MPKTVGDTYIELMQLCKTPGYTGRKVDLANRAVHHVKWVELTPATQIGHKLSIY